MPQLPDNHIDESTEFEIEIPLHSLDSKYKDLVNASPLPVIVTDLDDNIELVNRPARTFLGYGQSEPLIEKLSDIVRTAVMTPLTDLRAHLTIDRNYHGEWEFLNRKNGQWTQTEVFARVTTEGFRFFYLNDLTERNQAEELRLAAEIGRSKLQKAEALERLAGGIAHDFNNLLAVILLHTDMLNLQLPPASLFRHRVNEIRAVSNDAAGIVRQLLAFGRKQPMNPTPVVLNNIIGNLALALPKKVGPEIDVETDLDPDLGVCFVDQNQVAQAITYLAVNANDAMPDGGILRIDTRNIVVDKQTSHAAQSSGSYIQISVSDNGVGMNAKTEEHIFEPFFSTKESDKGAGLGLATVYGIVKQSGGFIWVESVIDHGTTFKIQFPRVDLPAHVPTPEIETNDLLEIDDETILLVDDDKSVRQIAAEILRLSGYQVLEAGSGMEAMEVARSFGSPIHLLLTDCLMPKMSGNVTAESIRRLYPKISILLMSGNIEDMANREKALDHGYFYLGKPFSSSALTKKVREVLAS